jgi:DNA-binding transcriptional LysR family regulator
MIDNRWDELDSSLFKAFVFAARELNFTRAAEKAAMTQSGVSQKIAKLEAQVGQALFSRVNKNLFLTEAGHTLLSFIEQQQDELQNLFEKLGHGQRTVRGPVRYAMPHSCLFTPHFPQLLKAREHFPDVTLKISLISNEEIVRMLVAREIDFGFLTQKSDNPALHQELFAAEEYALVGSPKLIKKLNPSVSNLNSLPFVNYPGMQNLFELWKKAVTPKRRALNFESLNLAGEINSLHGAVTMLSHGVGFSVLPTHVVAQELINREVEVVKFESDRSLSKRSVTNRSVSDRSVSSEIYICTLVDDEPPARVKAVVAAFFAMKK